MDNPHKHKNLVLTFAWIGFAYQAAEEVSKHMLVMKQILLGEVGEGEPTEPNQELITQLANEVYQHEIIPHLISYMPRLEFEVRSRANLQHFKWFFLSHFYWYFCRARRTSPSFLVSSSVVK
jgi:hypothetical protein